MKNKIIFIVFIAILTVCTLCACIPDRLEEIYIELPHNYYGERERPIIIGEYKVARGKRTSVGIMYETKLGEQEGLLDIYRNSIYYVAEDNLFTIVNSKNLEDEMYLDKSAIWLCDGTSVWVCQAYGNKRVRVARFANKTLDTNDMTVEVKLSCAFLTSVESIMYLDVQYATPFSWTQLKVFFPNDRVNEEEKSIVLDCKYKMESDTWQNNGLGKTKMYFNENDNTIEVSSDYTPISQYGG